MRRYLLVTAAIVTAMFSGTVLAECNEHPQHESGLGLDEVGQRQIATVVDPATSRDPIQLTVDGRTYKIVRDGISGKFTGVVDSQGNYVPFGSAPRAIPREWSRPAPIGGDVIGMATPQLPCVVVHAVRAPWGMEVPKVDWNTDSYWVSPMRDYGEWVTLMNSRKETCQPKYQRCIASADSVLDKYKAFCPLVLSVPNPGGVLAAGACLASAYAVNTYQRNACLDEYTGCMVDPG